MDLINFRNVLSKFATGVTVVSTIDTNNNPIGMTVNSFSSVSLDPPLVLWSIGIKQPSYDIFMNAKGYSVNILSKFFKPMLLILDKFKKVKYKLSENGFPIIKNSLAWFDCVKWKYYPGGDHQILVAEVKSFFANKYDPLIFWNGSLV